MKILCKVLTIVFIISIISEAQWKTTVQENNIICNEPSTQNYVEMAPDGMGGAFIVWTDQRNYNSNSNDIYIQRIDKDGYVQFATNGIPVCTAANDQVAPKIVYTDDSCAVVIWFDDRTNFTNATDLYAQKIDINGNMLWTENGVPVSEYNDPTPGGLSEFSATSDGNGGVYIAWTKVYFGYRQMRAQWISSNGTKLWGDARIVTDGPVDTRNPRIVKHPLGVALVYRYFGYGGYPILFQMMDAAGNLIFNAPGAVVAETGPQAGTIVVLADTDAGEAVAISWSLGQFGLNGKLYAQVMDVMGNKKWGANGVLVNDLPGEHYELSMLRDTTTGDYYFLWKDGRRINVANDIYAQKLNSNGQAQWTENGIKLSSTPYSFTSTTMSLNDNGIYAAWSEANNPQGHGIYVIRINPDSTFAWQNGPVRINTTFDNPVGMLTLNPDINSGGAVVLFNPRISTINYDVHTKFIGANGNLGGVTTIEENNYIKPNDFYLSQNYPNPFNPTTRISWQTPVNSHQTLKVYDVLGNEVATLVDEFREAGRYEILFDAAGLSSGTYFYRLRAGEFTDVKKILLLK